MSLYEKVSLVLTSLFREKGFVFDEIDGLDLIDDLAMDSLIFVSIVVEIENSFKIVVEDDYLEMSKFRNIKKIVAIIESYQQKEEK